MRVQRRASAIAGHGLFSVSDEPQDSAVLRQEHQLVSLQQFKDTEAAGRTSEFHGIQAEGIGVVLLGTPERPSLDYFFNSSSVTTWNVEPQCVQHDADSAVLEWRTIVPVQCGIELLWKYDHESSA
eukprot:gene15522-10053_t